jgi:hypothetical protein
VRPERFLLPLAAIALAVFATSRLMVAIDPGEAHPTAITGAHSDNPSDSGGKAGRKPGGRKRHRKQPGGGHSFYSPAGVRSLQRLIRKEAGPAAVVSLFRLQAEEAQIFTRTGNGGRMLVVERGPRVRFQATTPIGTPGGFDPSFLDVNAPRRILAAIARIAHVSERNVDYMVFSTNPVDRGGRWDAFLTGGATHFAADSHGRRVTRP